MEGSVVPNGMLEIPAIPKSVAHVLVVWALGVEDDVQRALASAGSSSGARGRWSARRVLLREASSPSVCRATGLYRVVVLLVQASLLR